MYDDVDDVLMTNGRDGLEVVYQNQTVAEQALRYGGVSIERPLMVAVR